MGAERDPRPTSVRVYQRFVAQKPTVKGFCRSSVAPAENLLFVKIGRGLSLEPKASILINCALSLMRYK